MYWCVCLAGGAVLVVCPPAIIAPDKGLTNEFQMDSKVTLELSEEARRLASMYPVQHNDNFSVLRDSVCIACLVTKAGTVHAYVTNKEATATAHHFFFFADNECKE